MKLPKKLPNLQSRTGRLAALATAIVVVGLIGLVINLTSHKQPDIRSIYTIENMVSKHMILPAGEEPALVTVTDPSKLTTPFLKATKRGDKLLIYQKAQRVIIYRPGADRIVDVGPVDIQPINGSTGSTSSNASGTSSTSDPTGGAASGL